MGVGGVIDVIVSSILLEVSTGNLELGVRVAARVFGGQVLGVQDIEPDIALFVLQYLFLHVLPVNLVGIIWLQTEFSIEDAHHAFEVPDVLEFVVVHHVNVLLVEHIRFHEVCVL